MSQINFHIKEDISEIEKFKKRQVLLSGVRDIGGEELFKINFNAEKVGKKNCENLIGSVEIPVGIVGPIKFQIQNPLLHQGFAGQAKLKIKNIDVLIPLATTEGALVASINRGCKIINQSGGAKVFVKKIGK